VLQTMTGTTAAAWSDPARGAELARSQLDRGADVIFAAAGASGLGALQAIADAGKLSIGVDSNQNPLHPGSVLTSMVKRVDVAVYKSLMAAHDGTWHRLGARRQQPSPHHARDDGESRTGAGRYSGRPLDPDDRRAVTRRAR
jgi:basic membrane lipoprotein Med (substrate-binding protein (PBP1-ABC) superfamily)